MVQVFTDFMLPLYQYQQNIMLYLVVHYCVALQSDGWFTGALSNRPAEIAC